MIRELCQQDYLALLVRLFSAPSFQWQRLLSELPAGARQKSTKRLTEVLGWTHPYVQAMPAHCAKILNSLLALGSQSLFSLSFRCWANMSRTGVSNGSHGEVLEESRLPPAGAVEGAGLQHTAIELGELHGAKGVSVCVSPCC